MAPKTSKKTAFEEHGYEFLGPPGAFFISFILPVVVYIFAFACNDVTGCPPPSLLHPSTLTLAQLKREVGWPAEGIVGLFSWEALLATIGYVLVNAILYRVLPAEEVQGVKLRNGERLSYRLNTFYCHSVMLAVLAAGTAAQGAHFIVWTFISDNYIQIITANILLAYATATYVYVHSFSVKPGNKELRELAAGGQSGNILYDWFIGRELNPRVTLPFIGEIDLKEWLELRPGMFGWVLMNFVWMAKQHRTFGYVTDSMVLISVVQALYVVDSWWNESAILTTMDITTDGFGMMLAFGDFVWEPFAYALQTRYLAHHPVHLGPVYLTLMLAIIAAGYYIFRSANSQKNRFRINPDDPQVAHLTFIETKSGSKLLTSGWWGVSRHINYLGDWLQAWAYCLPCGVSGYQILSAGSNAPGSYLMTDGREVIQGEARGWAIPLTCFYIIYFAVLLVHREGRDDIKCHRKYGKDWDRYKTIVRSKIIPGIY
ncbi:ergosterol biosynthesis ERG4/ERG24 [Emericellopsis atlantica]|uniref:Delta(14)-sterol reductase n=1 Tax=Emericellopsis atlantica TaxID=2614577 RepID=A0A9P7ZRR5_9HYPO|nr:ergosterol biosynthesis ERG4/ERG24 [Emericellopsis atlantica]KAG9257138.1 ergosterol biosynthesis ERG4/ERG24 [Emericellopsis atlantica]